jgi:Fe-S cluster assembly iron-binding protein IscA
MIVENINLQITEKARAAMVSALKSATKEPRIFRFFVKGYG